MYIVYCMVIQVRGVMKVEVARLERKLQQLKQEDRENVLERITSLLASYLQSPLPYQETLRPLSGGAAQSAEEDPLQT